MTEALDACGLTCQAFLFSARGPFRLGQVVFENRPGHFSQKQWAIIGQMVQQAATAMLTRGRLPGSRGTHLSFPTSAGLSPEAISYLRLKIARRVTTRRNGPIALDEFEEEASLRVLDFLSCERVMGVNPFEIRNSLPLARCLNDEWTRHLTVANSSLGRASFHCRTEKDSASIGAPGSATAFAPSWMNRMLAWIFARANISPFARTTAQHQLRVLFGHCAPGGPPRHITLAAVENLQVKAADLARKSRLVSTKFWHKVDCSPSLSR
jgi:hypothetical protein